MIRKLAPAVVAGFVFASVGVLPAAAAAGGPGPIAPPSFAAPANPGPADPGGPGNSPSGWQDQLCRVMPWFCS